MRLPGLVSSYHNFIGTLWKRRKQDIDRKSGTPILDYPPTWQRRRPRSEHRPPYEVQILLISLQVFLKYYSSTTCEEIKRILLHQNMVQWLALGKPALTFFMHTTRVAAGLSESLLTWLDSIDFFLFDRGHPVVFHYTVKCYTDTHNTILLLYVKCGQVVSVSH
jgi:hypothetical protein